VQRYIEISSAARKKYVPPPSWHAGATYIELFSGPGRSLIRGTKRIIDGSPLIAFKAAQANVPFTEMHLNDFDAGNSAAVDARIRALGGAAICYSDPADVVVDEIERDFYGCSIFEKRASEKRRFQHRHTNAQRALSLIIKDIFQLDRRRL
jgi:three-Cys-motif partner protein